jgi:ribulose-phosphate 3-epimerase
MARGQWATVVQAFVSLWSADPLEVGRAIDIVDGAADGIHVDVMDGHYVPELLFGPDFVSAVCQRTTRPVEVHLMVADADRWIEPFAKAGGSWIAIHLTSTNDPLDSLREIERCGSRASLALTVDEPLDAVKPYINLVDRILLMGTEIGIKGAEPDDRTYERVAELVRMRNRSERRPHVIVDGGIRRGTVPLLAEAGADGVIPGSLVFASPEPTSVLSWIHSLDSAAQATS